MLTLSKQMSTDQTFLTCLVEVKMLLLLAEPHDINSLTLTYIYMLPLISR